MGNDDWPTGARLSLPTSTPATPCLPRARSRCHRLIAAEPKHKIRAMQISAGHRPTAVPDARRRRRSGAPSGSRNGNYKHGRYTAEVAAMRGWLREVTQMLRELSQRQERT
jgi:hypothetical protein